MKKEYEAPEAKRLRFELTDALMEDGSLTGPSSTEGGGPDLPWNTQGTNGYNSGKNPY